MLGLRNHTSGGKRPLAVAYSGPRVFPNRPSHLPSSRTKVSSMPINTYGQVISRIASTATFTPQYERKVAGMPRPLEECFHQNGATPKKIVKAHDFTVRRRASLREAGRKTKNENILDMSPIRIEYSLNRDNGGGNATIYSILGGMN